MKILITGGTGLIGKRLTEILLKKGYQVAILSRKKKKMPNIEIFEWNIEKQYIEQNAFDGVDYVVHLAGEGIAEKSWTDKRKKEIIDSRVKPIELINKYLNQQKHQVKGFISASAIGFYGGDTGDNIITEESPAGNDFLANCTIQWESAANQLVENLKIRGVNLRVGVVLAEEGGALPKITQPIKLGLGSALGSGKQWISWIALEDIARLFLYAIENETMQGNYNAVAPKPLRNEELTKIIAQKLNRPLFLPNVPALILKMIFGEMSIVVLGGNYVKNQRIELETGFEYEVLDMKYKQGHLITYISYLISQTR